MGLFRGTGAVFGVLSTFLFRPVMQRTNLVTASIAFIWTEAGGLLLALIMFLLDTHPTVYMFMIFILISRVGLYGFCIGEVQVAQLGIRADQRGAVNSIESSLTSAATMIVYLFGAVLYQLENFRWLVLISTTCVTAGAVIVTIWSQKEYSAAFWTVTDADDTGAHDDEERVILVNEGSEDELDHPPAPVADRLASAIAGTERTDKAGAAVSGIAAEAADGDKAATEGVEDALQRELAGLDDGVHTDDITEVPLSPEMQQIERLISAVERSVEKPE